MALKVSMKSSSIISGLNYAITNGARISSHSYGGLQGKHIFNVNILKKVLDNNPDHLHIAAAGNQKSEIDRENSVYYPCSANAANQICVGGTDKFDEILLYADNKKGSNWSNRFVHVMAPGKDVRGARFDGGYMTLDGTSWACPHVSGLAALLMTMRPDLTVLEIKQLIEENVQPKPQYANLVTSGGLIDVGKTIKAMIAVPCPNVMYVSVSNQAHTAQKVQAGKYIKQDGKINGHPYWAKGGQRLWFAGSSWYVGSKFKLGQNANGLVATQPNSVCPTGLSNWNYYDQVTKTWLLGGQDVKVQAYKEVSCPERVLITVKNHAEPAQGYRAGVYSKQEEETNGYPYWVRGNEALWFAGRSWQVGPKSRLGQSFSGLFATKLYYSACPIGLPWLYFDTVKEKKWLEAGDDVKVQPYKVSCKLRTKKRTCHSIQDKNECLTSIDNRTEVAGSFDTKDQDCAWCITVNGKCPWHHAWNVCMGKNWLEYRGKKEGKDFVACLDENLDG